MDLSIRDQRAICARSESIIIEFGHLPYSQLCAKFAESGLKVLCRSTVKRYRRAHGVTYDAVACRMREGNPAWSDIPDRVQPDGYVLTRVIEGDRSKWVVKQRVEWERVHGPIPPGHRLMCLGDKTNCDPANWRLVSHKAASYAALHSPVKMTDAPHELRPALVAIAEIRAKVKER